MSAENQNQFSNFKKITLSSDKKLQMRANLAEFMRANPISVTPTPVAAPQTQSPFLMFMLKTQRAFAVLVVVAGVLGVIKVSEGARPGDILYPVKIYLADPINNVFEEKRTDLPADAELMEEATLKASDSSVGAEAGEQANPASERTMMFSTDLNLDAQTDQADDTGTPQSLKTDSNVVLPSVGPTAVDVVPESGRIKILYPDRYVVAKTGNKLEIKWENNLLGTEGGKTNTVNITLYGVKMAVDDEVKSYTVIQGLDSLEIGTYTWIVPAYIDSGYYKMRIIPNGEIVMSGVSEEFAIVKE